MKQIHTIKSLKKEIRDLKLKLQTEKLKNNIYSQIIEQKLGIKLSDKTSSNNEKLFSEKDLRNIYDTLHLAIFKEPKKNTYRSVKNITLDTEENNDLKKTRIPIIDEQLKIITPDNNIKNSLKIIDDSFLSIQTTKTYKKFLDNIKKERYKILFQTPIKEFITILETHIKKLNDILIIKKYDTKKVKKIIDTSLSPLESRLIFYDTYTVTSLDIDDIQKFDDSLTINTPYVKNFSPFVANNFFYLFFNYSCVLFPIKHNIKRFLINKYEFWNVIYLDIPKSTSDDPFSFYHLEKIDNETRFWKMDCRLDDLSSDFIHNIKPFLINTFRKMYNDIFHDSNFRKDFQSKLVSIDAEIEQLLRNIILLINTKNFSKLICEIVKENSTYTPTPKDKFNIYSDDQIQKRKFKNYKITDDDIYNNFRIIFDDISQADALTLYHQYV